MGYSLGIDVGSITTKVVVLDEQDRLLTRSYLRNNGRPIEAIQSGMEKVQAELGESVPVSSVGTTGSARQLAAYLVGADVVKNEITAHAVAVVDLYPEAKTIIEIGGQDSKVILLRGGVVVDFAMNTVCAAGTGSFLDQQSSRLGLSIETFGELALKSDHPTRIAGRCTVFAETDMIHKQQMGHPVEDILAGLCSSLVQNYLNNVCRGKELLSPVIFQGGVAANQGIRKAIEKELGYPVVIPDHFDVMGAIGAAKLARRSMPARSEFRGFRQLQGHFRTRGFDCEHCENHCEVMELRVGQKVAACWGDLCERYRSPERNPS
jgi:predicted CoA-substrate-specific enzyme activase